jgi:hypothetical protein
MLHPWATPVLQVLNRRQLRRERMRSLAPLIK